MKNIDFENLTRDDIIKLLNLSGKRDIKKLFDVSAEIKKRYFGDEVIFRGVIEFSNFCKGKCLYCGLREDNFSVERYRMTTEEIIDAAQKISNFGIKSIVLQSGEDHYFDTDMISFLIYQIKRNTDISISLCLGERDFEEYKAWKIAGADRYIMKHEVANAEKYEIYHVKNNFEERFEHIKYLKRLGYKLGTGAIIGLPLQTIEDIADDLLLVKSLSVDTAIFNPFIPAEFTPYKSKPAGDFELTLKTIAIARILMPEVQIPAPATLDVLNDEGREEALKIGANVILPNFTPKPYRNLYELFPGLKEEKEPENSGARMQYRVEAIGMKVSTSSENSIDSKTA